MSFIQCMCDEKNKNNENGTTKRIWKLDAIYCEWLKETGMDKWYLFINTTLIKYFLFKHNNTNMIKNISVNSITHTAKSANRKQFYLKYLLSFVQ